MLQEMARCCRRCWLGGWLRPGRTGEYDEPRSWCWVLLPRRSAWRPQLAPGYCPARPLTGYNKSTAPSPILPPPLLSCYYTTTLTTQPLSAKFPEESVVHFSCNSVPSARSSRDEEN